MKPKDPLPATVFARLCQQPVVNGQSLARALGVSRAAIWKAVRFLRDAGVPIAAVSGSGYRLTQRLSPLDAETLQTQRPPGMGLRLLFSTTSTNDDARALDSPGFVLAEHQHRGRGRMGRQWLSVPGGSIVLSGRWDFAGGIADLAGLNLAVAAAVVDTAADFGWHLGVKWPNDLVSRDEAGRLQKIGGVLIEISGEMEGPCQAVVGLGLNWQLPPETCQRIEQAVANLTDLPRRHDQTKTNSGSQAVDRSAFVAHLLNRLNECVRGWCDNDAVRRQAHRQQVLDTWWRHDALLNQPVVVRSTLGPSEAGLHGICRGVDASGALILERNGQRETLHSGELSLRAEQQSPA